MKQLGQYGPPRHVIAHLSDPHILAGALQYGAVDTEARCGPRGGGPPDGSPAGLSGGRALRREERRRNGLRVSTT